MPDPALALQSVRMIDLLLEFFDGGKNWTRGELRNHDTGGRCLIGAMAYIRAPHRLHHDPTRQYILDVLPNHWRFTGLATFNDCHPGGWPIIEQALKNARLLALRDANGVPRPKITKPAPYRENPRLAA